MKRTEVRAKNNRADVFILRGVKEKRTKPVSIKSKKNEKDKNFDGRIGERSPRKQNALQRKKKAFSQNAIHASPVDHPLFPSLPNFVPKRETSKS